MASSPETEGWFFPRSVRAGPISRGAHTYHYAKAQEKWSLCGEWPYMGEFFRKDMVKIPPPLEPENRCRRCLRKLRREEKKHT